MKLKYKFVIQKFGDKFVAVTTDEDAGKFNGMIRVNELGMKILEILKNETTRESLNKSLESFFENKEEMDLQIDSFICTLKKSDLLI